jgi:hypothetical protein
MAFGKATLLEYKDVQFFKVQQMRCSPNVSLQVSGLAFHSSLVVESIETRIDHGCMVVLVNLVPARSGLKGNFTFDFDVPKEVNSVCFGPTKHVIWQRGIGPVE